MVHKLSHQGMQSPAGDVHVRRIAGDIERRELSRQPGRVRGRDPSLTAGPEEPLDSLVAKGSYHRAIVAYGATHHKAVIGGSKGVFRLSRQRRNDRGVSNRSSSRGRRCPRATGFGSKEAQGRSVDQVSLNIEVVVDGSVSREEPLR